MKKFLILMMSVMIVLFFGASSQALLIDFEGLADGDFVGTSGNPLLIDGFSFNYIGYGEYQQIMDLNGNNIAVDSNENSVYGAEVRIFNDTVGSFYLNSFEYGDYLDDTDLGYFAMHVRVFNDQGQLNHLELHPTQAGLILDAMDLGVEGILLTELRINLVSYAPYGGNFYYDNLDLDPVPEPATMLLLGSGLIGLAGFRRKKFKK